jgi:hypothetical protein
MAEKKKTTKIKFIRGVNYKGAEFKAGATAEVEPHVAERIIADGNAEIAARNRRKKKSPRSNGVWR